MALLDNVWYVDFGNGSTTGYYAVAKYSNKAWVAGNILRQLTTPAVGSERCFVVHVGGTSTGEPTWTVTRGAINPFTTAGSCIECTGVAALNGDLSNTPTWTQYRTATGGTATQGQVIQSGDGTKILICRTGGSMAALGSEPTWAAYTTAGATTNDGVTPVVWVTLQASPFSYAIWNAPQARLANALLANWAEVGNGIFMSASHAETQASAITITFPGTSVLPNYCYCVSNTPATTPPGPTDVTTGATITSTGNSSITVNGSFVISGVTLNVGTGGNNQGPILAQNASYQEWVNCALNIVNTGVANTIIGGGVQQSKVIFDNTTLGFTAITQSFVPRGGLFVWRNTASAITGSTLPSVFLFNSASGAGNTIFQGVDLSAFGSGKALVGALNPALNVFFLDCKFNASVTIAATSATPGGPFVTVIRSDSAGTNYQQQLLRYEGTLIPETTIVRTGGAQVTGTGISWNIATTANSTWINPFETFLMATQNSTTGSNVTVTVHGICKLASLPNNAQIWISGDYLGSSSSPLGTVFAATKANVLASGSPQTADTTSAWGAGAAAYQTSHAYGAFTGVVLAGNASPQQLWFMVSHSGTGTSGGSSSIFNGQADGAQVTDNAGANQIVWQAMMRFSMSFTMSTPQPAQQGQINVRVNAGLAATTFYIDPQLVLS